MPFSCMKSTPLFLPSMQAALESIAAKEIVIVDTPRLSPLAFPIWAEHIQARLTTQGWRERIADMARELEQAAGGTPARGTGRR